MLNEPDMNKPVFKVFSDAKTDVETCVCPFCKKPIIESEFRDELSKKEYSISGICQKCQDGTFGR